MTEIGVLYYCLKGDKQHHVFKHHNVGANVFWCPIHGMLLSEVIVPMPDGTSEEDLGSWKDMTDEEYRKFE